MHQVENYKGRAPGAVLPSEGRIVICPRCGRPGVERVTEDGLVCIHSESLEMQSDGLLVEPVDFCAVPEHPRERGSRQRTNPR